MKLGLLPVFAGLLWPAWGGASPPPPAAYEEPVPPGYQMVFQDEFDRPQLDSAKWNTTMAFAGRQGGRYHNINYLHYVMDDDVLLNGSTVQLRAAKRGLDGDDPPGHYEYSAGLITSHDKYSFKYGYIVMRAKYPGGHGVWPAFWLIGQEQYWPPEFDIAEYYGGAGVMHYGLCHGTLKNVEWDSTGDKESQAEAGWHTFALDWLPGKARWLVDGIVKKTVEAEYVPNIPMYIIMSNGVSSGRGPSGIPDEGTIFPNFLEVDYVRVYQACPTIAPPAAPAAPAPLLTEERKPVSLLPKILATPGP